MGLGFRRQQPVGRYIVDFACPVYHLIVELDGTQHADERNLKLDAERTQYLESRGWAVLRFWNDDVLRDLEGVCAHIIATVRQMQELAK